MGEIHHIDVAGEKLMYREMAFKVKDCEISTLPRNSVRVLELLCQLHDMAC